MSLNRLHQLVTTETSPTFGVATLKTAQNGAPFVMHTFKKQASSTSITDTDETIYYLDSDHVSFYKVIDSHNPCLSEYHYTAYFTDNKGQSFQLHVYFNQQDALTTNPVLKLASNLSIQQLSPHLSSQFVELAISRSGRFIQQLRKEYNAKLNSLKEDYQEAEEVLQTLSLDLQKNKTLYLKQLEETIKKLNLLIGFNDNPFYPSCLNRFNAIKTLLTAPAPKPLYVSDEILPFAPTTEAAPSNVPSIQKEKETAAENIKKINTYQVKLQTSIQANESLQKQVLLFSEYNTEILSTLLLIEEGSYVANMEEIQLLQKLCTSSTHQGIEFLKLALIKNDLVSAQILKQFTPHLSDNLISMAIVTKKAKVLDFLLQHCKTPINTFIVKDELTPVLFCFKHASREIKEIFDVLIQHGASIMVKETDGLPLAHHIVKQGRQHPLYSSLESHFKQASFWQQLASQLHNYLNDHPKLSDDKKNDLKRDIGFYLASANIEVSKSTSSQSSSTKRILEETNKLSKQYLTKLEKKLNNEPDIQEKEALLKTTYKKFQLLCKRYPRYKECRKETYYSIFDLVKLCNYETYEYAEVKPTFVNYLQNRIDYFSTYIALINHVISSGQRTKKGVNKFNRTLDDLLDKMQQLEKDNPFPSESGMQTQMMNELKKQLGDSFNEIMKVLDASKHLFGPGGTTPALFAPTSAAVSSNTSSVSSSASSSPRLDSKAPSSTKAPETKPEPTHPSRETTSSDTASDSDNDDVEITNGACSMM